MPTASPAVISALQTSASLHWTATEHYTTISSHLSRIGYKKLGDRFAADVEEERGHLGKVLGRLEYYLVAPTYAHAAPEWPRQDVPGILAASLALEERTAATERGNAVTARDAGDELSALVFADLLAGSEASVEQITGDLIVISQVGVDNWLANLI